MKFPLLSSNTYVNGALVFFEASTIVDKDKTVEGDEFVVIGVTTPETATKTHPKNIKGVTLQIQSLKSIRSSKKFKPRLVQKVRTTNTMLCWLTWVWIPQLQSSGVVQPWQKLYLKSSSQRQTCDSY